MTELGTERFKEIFRVSILPAAVLLFSFLISFVSFFKFSGTEIWIPSIAFGGLGIVFFLSLLIRQSRVTFFCLNLILATWLVPLFSSPEQRPVYLLAVFLMTANLAIFGIQKNRGLFTGFGLMIFSLLALEALLVFLVFYFQTGVFNRFLNLELFQSLSLDAFQISDTILLTGVLVLAVLGIQMIRDPGYLEASLFWTVIPVVTAFNWIQESWIFFVQLSAVGLMLCAGILLHSNDMAFRDELTRLPSRRSLEQYLLTLGRKYTIAMVDIDHFKKVNDSYGHDVGDQVLKLIASRLARARGARAFRYGGEEFTLIFPRKKLGEILPLLEQLRKQIKGYKIVIRLSDRLSKRTPKSEKAKRTRGSFKRPEFKALSVTISIGAAAKTSSEQEPTDVIALADKALYEAKKTGRNRICQA